MKIRIVDLLLVALLIFPATYSEAAKNSKKSDKSGKTQSQSILVIVSAWTDAEQEGIQILGQNLSNKKGSEPTVTLAGHLLQNLSYSDAEIIAELPAGLNLGGGTHLLTVSTGSSATQSDTFAMTLGSIGSEGPMGATGLAGPAGPQGEQGALGAVGEQGETGKQGPAGEPGLQGPIGGIGPEGLQGEPGVAGLAGPQGSDGENAQLLDVVVTLGRDGYNYGHGYAPLTAHKINGIVYLNGLVSCSRGNCGPELATLPSGFRPDKRLLFNTGVIPTFRHDRVDVLDDGTIYVSQDGGGQSTGFVNLSGISFRAAN